MKNPFRREQKSSDVLPESLWQQMVAAQDMYGTIGTETAVGLPALLAVIRLISHTAALVPLDVLRGDEDAVRERARDTWQWKLLHKRPGPPPTTPFNFKADLAAHFCGRGNAYVRKLKPSGQSFRLTGEAPRVTELLPLNPEKVQVRRSKTGVLVYVDSTGSESVDRGTDEVIQIRSFSVSKDGLTGVAPITAARRLFTAGLRRQQFEDSHLKNGISPSILVQFAKGMGEEQAGRWLDFIEGRHQGAGKSGKAIGVPFGSDIKAFPVSLADAQFAEMTRLTMEQAAAMYQVPFALALPGRNGATDDDWRNLMTFAVGPVLAAMSEAFTADDDLFKLGVDDDLTVVPNMDAPMRFDPLKKAQVQREQIQTGTRLADEVRAQDGYESLPPVPKDWTQEPGKVPQITPVGGAENPTIDTSTARPGTEGDPIG